VLPIGIALMFGPACGVKIRHSLSSVKRGFSERGLSWQGKLIVKHHYCSYQTVFYYLFYFWCIFFTIIFFMLSMRSLAGGLEECVFTLKEMNQYFSSSGLKDPIDYRSEWFSYDTGQYFVTDKKHDKIYSYFVGYGRIGALDVNGKASLIEIPFKFPIGRAVAVVMDRDSGTWGSIFFHEDKIISKKLGEINPLPEEFFPTPDVNGKFLIRPYKDGGNAFTPSMALEGGYFCAAKTKKSGAVSFGYFSLGKQRKVTRPGGRNQGRHLE
jgi:hypothetical protein